MSKFVFVLRAYTVVVNSNFLHLNDVVGVGRCIHCGEKHTFLVKYSGCFQSTKCLEHKRKRRMGFGAT